MSFKRGDRVVILKRDDPYDTGVWSGERGTVLGRSVPLAYEVCLDLSVARGSSPDTGCGFSEWELEHLTIVEWLAELGS